MKLDIIHNTYQASKSFQFNNDNNRIVSNTSSFVPTQRKHKPCDLRAFILVVHPTSSYTNMHKTLVLGFRVHEYNQQKPHDFSAEFNRNRKSTSMTQFTT